MEKNRRDERSRGWWRVKALAAALSLLLAFLAWGCGGEEEARGPTLEEVERRTLEGSYQVKAREGDKVLGVGIYGGGSFRVVMEGVPRVVIYDQDAGRAWMVNLQRKTYREIGLDEAGKRAGFLPSRFMKPYFGLPSFWDGRGFRMETGDGRLVTARLDGPGGLPSAWEARGPGGTIKKVEWEYRRVGGVSEDNFRLPEGLTPE